MSFHIPVKCKIRGLVHGVVLLGELSYCEKIGSTQKKLMSDLRYHCKLDVSESILRVILGGGEYALNGLASISDLLLSRKDCFVGKAAYCEEEIGNK